MATIAVCYFIFSADISLDSEHVRPTFFDDFIAALFACSPLVFLNGIMINLYLLFEELRDSKVFIGLLFAVFLYSIYLEYLIVSPAD
jgi:hypothetical protein